MNIIVDNTHAVLFAGEQITLVNGLVHDPVGDWKYTVTADQPVSLVSGVTLPDDYKGGTYTYSAGTFTKTAAGTTADAVILAGLKADKNAEINDARLSANQTTFTYAGKLIACDALSRSDIDGITDSVTLTNAFPANFPNAWKCVDNSYVAIPDVATWKLFIAAMLAQGTMNFGKSQSLKATLAAATTAEQVAAITW